MFELILYVALGIILGTITGLIPGLHVNAVAFFLLTLPLSGDIKLGAALISLAVTHSLLDFIPSIYLGAPQQDSALSILPGHRMLMEGKGLEALMLTAMGGILGLLFLLATMPLLASILQPVYSSLKNYIASILLGVSSFLLLGERKFLPALFVLLASGVLGIISLKYEISLFACLSGFFGVSTMLFSMFSRTEAPQQTEYRVNIGLKESLAGSIAGFASGLMLSMLPAMGSSQAGVLAQRFVGKDDRKFLISLGAINTVVTLASILTLYIISRARSGVAVAVEKILGTLSIEISYILVGSAITAAGISALLLVVFGRQFSRLVRKIDYRKISLGVITLLFFEVLITGGWWGIILFLTSTAIGLYAQCSGITKSSCMNFLIIPTTLLYLALSSH